MSLAYALNTNIQRISNFFGFSRIYLKKKNPLKAIMMQAKQSFKEFLTLNKKARIAKFRVNSVMYNLQKMEKIINDNNPYTYKQGRRFNQLR